MGWGRWVGLRWGGGGGLGGGAEGQVARGAGLLGAGVGQGCRGRREGPGEGEGVAYKSLKLCLSRAELAACAPKAQSTTRQMSGKKT